MSMPIATIDVETDPFMYGRHPRPFAVAYYDGGDVTRFWGDDCMTKMFEHLEWCEPHIIFAHNGGRFDVYQGMMSWIMGSALRVINNRIVKATLQGRTAHQLRDSWAIMPYKLANMKGQFEKKEIDIAKLEGRVRESHKAEICEYLDMDVISLHEKCVRFFERFGDYLTVGSMAMKELRKRHEFEELDKESNDDIRARYYYGARVECFEKGHLFGDFKIYDVNSMYPYVMRTMRHPISGNIRRGKKRVNDHTFFLKVQGNQLTPLRPFLPYAFDPVTESWAVSIHEFNAAVECRLFEPTKVVECIDFLDSGTFDTYVDDFYSERMDCRARLDFVGEMLAKFALNSAYGKFAQDSARYRDWLLTDGTYDCSPGGWERRILYAGQDRRLDYVLWDRPTERDTVYNSAVGASITGAARSVLLRALADCERPVYCDTDSIACESMSETAALDAKQLGAWKLEATADEACICGRKTYAFFKDGERVKAANKGVPTWNKKAGSLSRGLSNDHFRQIANGGTVVIQNDAPTYKLDGSVQFIEREIRMT